MIQRKSLAALAALMALAACREAAAPPPPAKPPQIVKFTADNSQVNPGAAVKLSYEVEGATAVELIDDTGAFYQLSGDVKSGEATLSPVSTHFYVLRASGQGGRDSAFLQVAVGEPLKDVFLIAVPPSIKAGESTQLLWGALRNKSAQITASTGEKFDLTGDSGSLDVSPKQNTTYTLSADPGTGAPKLSTALEVRVTPVVSSFQVNPGAAHAGETMTLSWKTLGGLQLTITEQTFGKIFETTDSSQIASGTTDFTLPMTLPNGAALQDGLPLKFQLRVVGSSPESQAVLQIPAYVGTAPIINKFDAPAYVSATKTFTASWNTAAAAKVELFADGLPIFETLAGDAARVSSGSVTLNAPSQTTEYTLKATNSLGISTSKTLTVNLVQLPTIVNFTVPAISSAGGSGTVSWTTTNASRVTLRTASGANIFTTGNGQKTGAGTVDLGFGQTTSLTLEAMNEAGDVVTQTKDVLVPAGTLFSTTPGTSLANVNLTANYDLSSLSLASVAGVPDVNPVMSSGSTNFVDLLQQTGATELTFANNTDAVATVAPGQGFKFPFFGEAYGSFYVQIDGAVGLTPMGASSADNVDLPVSGVGQALAPFWETLQLGNSGKVSWYLDGTEFPRRLIIQWSNVAITGAAPPSDLTFQVQLYETGEFRYVYGTMSGANASAEDATVGVQAGLNNWHVQVPSNAGAATISSNSEIDWFAPASLSGTFTAAFPHPVKFPIMGVSATGRWTILEGKVRVFAKDSIRVSEVMAVPDSAATEGQWVELENTTSQPIDLDGLVLKATGSTTGFALPAGPLAPQDVLVVGQSTDTTMNGGAQVDYAFTDVPLSTTSDTLQLVVDNGVVSTFSYTAGLSGHSINGPQPYALAADAGTVSCPSNATFDTGMMSYGTPGTVNAPCLPYRVETIPVAFHDIASTGTAVFSSTSNDTAAAFSIAAHPFTYFGTAKSSVAVSANGFLNFSSSTSSTTTNRTVPASSGTYQGMIAPFWGHIHFQNGINNAPANPSTMVLAQYFAQGEDPTAAAAHWIFQWNHFENYPSSSPYTDGGDMLFQAKLFDDGKIEFHYATMVSGTAANLINLANGAEATIWIEQPGQPYALAIGRNQPVISSNSAWRFVPVP